MPLSSLETVLALALILIAFVFAFAFALALLQLLLVYLAIGLVAAFWARALPEIALSAIVHSAPNGPTTNGPTK